MNIKLNGKAEALGGAATIYDLVNARGLAPDKIVVEHNYRIVPKEEWKKSGIKENDNIEIVSFVGGG